MRVLIKQAKIIQAASPLHNQVMDILMEDNTIVSIAKQIDEAGAEKIISEKELIFSPGWVDLMADYAEPGYEYKEGIKNGLVVAAKGGFTDVVIVPNTQPSISNKAAVQFALQQAQGAPAKLHVLGSISNNIEGKDLAEMLDMHEQGAVGFTDGWKPLQNAALMLKALEYVKAFKGILVQIPMDSTIASNGLMHEGVHSTQLGMAGIPTIAETILLQRDIDLLRYTQSRLHISGVSCAASLAIIKQAKAAGLAITCDTTPYHLLFTDSALTSYNSLYKVMPPLRSEEDRQALIAALKDGTIDCIASHHRPQDWDAKQKEFEYASYGMAVQEYSFAALYAEFEKELSIERWMDLFANNARCIFNLPYQIIQEGASGNFSVVSLQHPNKLQIENGQSKSNNMPFDTWSCNAKVITTFISKN
ncbi:MAG: dihydroorotase [Bacteroidota bacterium]|nr:dihydroorotase [Bacteroidota bacterium]